jgi:hypothetical protein
MKMKRTMLVMIGLMAVAGPGYYGNATVEWDPATRQFTALPRMYPATEDMKKDLKKDPLYNSEAIAYNSKYDVYFTTGPTANDTWDPSVAGGEK